MTVPSKTASVLTCLLQDNRKALDLEPTGCHGAGLGATMPEAKLPEEAWADCEGRVQSVSNVQLEWVAGSTG